MIFVNSITEPGQPWVTISGSVLVLRAYAQEVSAEAIDGGLVLAPIVQHRLAAAPVVAVTPVIGQRLDLGEWGGLGPVVDCLRVRPAGLVHTAIQVLKVRLRDGEGEGGDGVIHPRRRHTAPL